MKDYFKHHWAILHQRERLILYPKKKNLYVKSASVVSVSVVV